MLTHEDIKAAFKWGPPAETQTKRGLRFRLNAPVTPEAEQFWKRNRSELTAAGVTFSEYRGKWGFTWWQTVPTALLQKRAENIEASAATDANVEIPCPPGLEYYGYQRAGVAFMNRCERGALLADEMGLGKTIQIVGWINSNPKATKILIVCPANLTLNWLKELRTWMTRPLQVGLVTGKTFPTSEVVIIAYSMLQKYKARLGQVYWDMIAADEAQNIKNPAALRSRVLLGYKAKKDEPVTLTEAPLPAKFRIASTGTPICNRPSELWPLVSWVDPVVFSSWWQFHSRYCGMQSTGYGMDRSGATNLEELQSKLRQTVMVRREKKDVLLDLPDKVHQIVTLPADEEALDAEAKALAPYRDRMERLQADVELAKAGDSQEAYEAAVAALSSGLSVAFTDMSRVRHETALAKLDAAVEYIEGDLESVNKCIIFAHHRDVIAKLAEKFGKHGVVEIHGGLTVPERMQSVTRFQNDPRIKVCVMGIMLATGLTLTAANYVYFVELDWVPGNMAQAEDRAHRIGQKDTVFVKQLVMENSVDANMAETLLSKSRVIRKAMNRVAGVTLPGVETDRPAPPPRWNEAAEPVVPVARGAVSSTRDELAELAATIDDDANRAIHRSLQLLAAMCDGAAKVDGAGFNKLDSRIGKDLASRLHLSAKQAALGLKLCNKYRRQLGFSERVTAETIK